MNLETISEIYFEPINYITPVNIYHDRRARKDSYRHDRRANTDSIGTTVVRMATSLNNINF